MRSDRDDLGDKGRVNAALSALWLALATTLLVLRPPAPLAQGVIDWPVAIYHTGTFTKWIRLVNQLEGEITHPKVNQPDQGWWITHLPVG